MRLRSNFTAIFAVTILAACQGGEVMGDTPPAAPHVQQVRRGWALQI